MVSYGAVVSACEKGEQWAGALAFLCEAPKQQLHPDMVSYITSISACKRGEQ